MCVFLNVLAERDHQIIDIEPAGEIYYGEAIVYYLAYIMVNRVTRNN